ncbi:AAA family ATPase [Amycolatopsis sp. NPDC051903]|uniref:AAA family ATPase n=1 Tax=Amycolatopsis sp. NPDC051903 TaxID=3363936 RepID=UPI0037B8B176
MTEPDTGRPFAGRERESARLRSLLAAAVAGDGGGFALRGAPGTGKTALLDHVVGSLPGHRIVRIRAAAAEAELPFSALHLLCSALAPDLAGLDRHRREALETAVALRPGPAPGRMLLLVGLVDLLARAAEAEPLLCVVDDAQWLDPASAGVLACAVTRVGALPVALGFAGRGEPFPGLPGVVLGGLAHADARRLFQAALRAPADAAVTDRIVAESRGVPGVLLDAAQATSAVETGGGYRVLPSAGAEVLALPPDSRALLVLAAAEPLGDPARLWRAAARLGIAVNAADRLESAGLVSFGTWVEFRRPALRSEIYGQASDRERRRAHAALAVAETEPDRQVWHRALALLGPDDAVAGDLVRAADSARHRGGLAAEAAFLERAALATARPGLRAERAIRAAEAHHAAGGTDGAVRLLAAAGLGSGGTAAHRVRARLAFDATRNRAAVEQLARSAAELAGGDPAPARSACLEALGAAAFTGHGDLVGAVLNRPCPSAGTDRLLDGVVRRCTAGYAAAVEPLKLALKTLDCDHEDNARARVLACLVAPELWDDAAWHELTHAELTRARSSGARAILPYALTHRALVEVHSGRFPAAQTFVTEARELTDAAGWAPFPHAAAVLAAWRGRAVPEPPHEGTGLAAALTRYAKAVLANAFGDYGEAVTATREVLDRDAPEWQGWSLVELVEGAARSGDHPTAAAALDRLCERAVLSGSDWALGAAARSRALLQHGPAAEDLYTEAIARLGRTRITTDVARAQLVYGEWLRRQGRRVDARRTLRAAHDSFTAMGADAFAQRAHRELLATGERARRRVPETRSQLTPQELRIALLARDGRSNPEIATALSISPRTVEYHLHKVFTKLAITSRTELHLVLAGCAD